MRKSHVRHSFTPNSRLLLFLWFLLPLTVAAQSSFDFSGQLMQRAEFRNGYGRLITEVNDPAFFIGQRARINASYTYKGTQFYVSAQDIRIWGSTAHTKYTDNFLSIYEAYLETKINDSWKVKLGRQELNYDNVRFLGNLDWALQGRSHDLALVKYEKESFKIHVGAAYNQAGQTLIMERYALSNHYKTAQILHLENKGEAFEWSVLFWNQGQEKQIYDVYGLPADLKNRYSQTIGLPVLRYKIKEVTLFGFYYHQLGRDILDRNINAFDVSTQVSWKRILNEEGRLLQMTIGAEYISGNDIPSDDKQRAFNPSYGTNHAHNGYMDYFFVGGRDNIGFGLFDRFLRLKYQPASKNFWSLNLHSFASNGEFQPVPLDVGKNLGIEVDLTTGFIFNEALSLQIGYSQFFASERLEIIQNAGNAQSIQNWAYVMLLFRPHSKNRFVGLLF